MPLRQLTIAALAACAALAAAAPAAAGPLEDCLGPSVDMIQARACLRSALSAADARLAEARANVRAAAARIDAEQGRTAAGLRVDAASVAFRTYREEACRLESAIAARGADPGAWEVACAIERTDARTEELRRLIEADAPRTVATGLDPEQILGDGDAGAFIDWRARCDEDGCAAIVFSEDDDGAPDYALLVSRASAAAGWEILSGRLVDGQAPDTQIARVNARVDAEPAAPMTADWRHGHAFLIRDPAAVSPLMDAMLAGGVLSLEIETDSGEATDPRFSLMGLSAALAWIEDSQTAAPD